MAKTTSNGNGHVKVVRKGITINSLTDLERLQKVESQHLVKSRFQVMQQAIRVAQGSGPTNNLDESMVRADFLRFLMDSNREINAECGYPDWLTPDHFRAMYDREGISKRVVDCEPEETWSMDPEIYEDEDPDTETDFEAAWEALVKKFNIIHHLQRIDVLSGIGQFGIMLLGIDDELPLHEPVDGVNPDGTFDRNKYNLLYLRPFDESVVFVKMRDTDTDSPRYGLPTMYTVHFRDFPNWGVQAGEIIARDIHWTRAIHVADNRKISEIYGIPRMQPVYNRLYDLRKIYAACGEAFWKGAFQALSFEVNPELADQGVVIDDDAMKKQMEKFQAGMQRYFATTGVSVKTIAPQIVDPTGTIEAQLKAIAICKAIPFRVLFGSEEAKLASGQDARAWNKRLQKRQTKYVTPLLVRPFIDRLIAFGLLPEPEEYFVDWPDLNAPTDQDKATTGLTTTQALAAYVQGSVNQLVPPQQYFTHILKMPQDEAEMILEAAEDDAMKQGAGNENDDDEQEGGDTEGGLEQSQPNQGNALEQRTLTNPGVKNPVGAQLTYLPSLNKQEGEKRRPFDGTVNENPNHDPATGRFSSGGGIAVADAPAKGEYDVGSVEEIPTSDWGYWINGENGNVIPVESGIGHETESRNRWKLSGATAIQAGHIRIMDPNDQRYSTQLNIQGSQESLVKHKSMVRMFIGRALRGGRGTMVEIGAGKTRGMTYHITNPMEHAAMWGDLMGSPVHNFNPYHDDLGRFAEASGSGMATAHDTAGIASVNPGKNTPWLSQPKQTPGFRELGDMHDEIISRITDAIGNLHALDTSHGTIEHTRGFSEQWGAEPSFVVHGLPNDPERAKQITAMLGLGLQQDAAFVSFPKDGKGNPDNLHLVLHLKAKKPLTQEQWAKLDHEMSIIKLDGYTGVSGGKAIQAMYFGDKAGAHDWAKGVAQAAGKIGVQFRGKRFYANTDRIQSSGEGSFGQILRGVGNRAGEAGRSYLLQRTFRDILAPSVNVLHNHGYKFDREKFAEFHHLSLKEIEALKAALDGNRGTTLNYDPTEPRDELGRWADEGGGGSEKAGSESTIETTKGLAPNSWGENSMQGTKADYMENGEYTAARKELHNKIITDAIKGHVAVSEPQLIMMGGGPASGKSTLTKTGIVNDRNHVHVDADEIKAQMPEYKQLVGEGRPEAANYVHEESSDISKRMTVESLTGGYNTLMDGTGDSSITQIMGKIDAWRAAGAKKIVAEYVTCPVDVALGRAERRALETGRHVNPAVIIATHKNVSRVVPLLITHHKCDELRIWDTDVPEGQKPIMVLEQIGNRTQVYDAKRWQTFLDKGK